MLHLSLKSNKLRLDDTDESLKPTHRTMLEFWHFTLQHDHSYVYRKSDISSVLRKLLQYLADKNLEVVLDENLEDILLRNQRAMDEYGKALRTGQAIKSGYIPSKSATEFLDFVRTGLKRKLLPHQEKAALHLYSVPHGANFSVPGAGKSSVVLAVFAWLRKIKIIRSIFVVGPRSCFAPWQYEYEETIGERPKVEVVAGGNVTERQRTYYQKSSDIADLYLTTYQTLSRDMNHVKALLRQPGNDAMFVVDEAHYIKQQDGMWAEAVLAVSGDAKKRCVLTGTPFPHSYSDALNIFNVLYPGDYVFSREDADNIRYASNKNDHDKARRILEPSITSLYYRVRKKDLGLSNPVFMPPIPVSMKPLERKLYEAVVNRIRLLANNEIERDYETIQRLKRGRLMRVRQVLSYSRLLFSAIHEYEEELLQDDKALSHKIARYDQYETPGKIDALLSEIQNLRRRGEKVIVWSNFIGSLELIQKYCEQIKGWRAMVICGSTPTQEGTDEATRDQIIEEFKDSGSGLDILIANPAACAESVSLHKTCSNAIYYDLSYNCAEYLQSLDRIHRVGGSETKVSYYRYLHYTNTIEPKILENVLAKAERMYQVIDGDFPLCLTDVDDMETVAYEQILG